MKAKRISLSVIAAVFSVLALVSSGRPETTFDWPRWRGPAGNGVSAEVDWVPESLLDGPKVVWRVDVGIGHSNVAITGNRVYTMSGVALLCLDGRNGREIWRSAIGGAMNPQSTPTIESGHVYGLTQDGIVACVDARSGKIIWRKDLVREYGAEKIPYGYSGSPVIEGDLVILNVNTAGMALDKRSGELVWKSDVHAERRNTQGYHATPVVYEHDGSRCALILSGTGLFSVMATTGEQLWYYEFFESSTANVADPEFFQDIVFLRGNYLTDKDVLLDISGTQPRVLWEKKNLRNDIGTCVLIGGYLYGSDGVFGQLKLRCIDLRTGEIMWEEKKMKSTVSLTAADNKLIILEQNGTLYVAEATPDGYIEISSCDVLEGEKTSRKFWTPPVLCNGRIYCRNYGGELICIDVSE